MFDKTNLQRFPKLQRMMRWMWLKEIAQKSEYHLEFSNSHLEKKCCNVCAMFNNISIISV